jgi:large subunit ribosomal protein L17
LFSNLVAALFTYEKIRTTDAKAKETARLAERTITFARRVGDVLSKKADKRSSEEAARVVHAVRMARRVVRDRGAVVKLFDEIAPRYLARRGGYTRIVKLGQRPGDAAPMSLLELIPDENAAAVKDTDTKAKGKAEGTSGEAKARLKADAGAKPAKAAKAPSGEKTAKKPAAKKSKTEE